jgi:hypothetical protein
MNGRTISGAGDSGQVDITDQLRLGANTLRFALVDKGCCKMTATILLTEDDVPLFSDEYTFQHALAQGAYDKTITIRRKP